VRIEIEKIILTRHEYRYDKMAASTKTLELFLLRPRKKNANRPFVCGRPVATPTVRSVSRWEFII
jgi:hypothetical protein